MKDFRLGAEFEWRVGWANADQEALMLINVNEIKQISQFLFILEKYCVFVRRPILSLRTEFSVIACFLLGRRNWMCQICMGLRFDWS